MNAPISHSRSIRTALILGILALLVNSLQTLWGDLPGLAIGNIFVYLSAMTLGVSGAVLSAACGLIPSGWGVTDLAISRSIITAFAVAIAKERFPRLPSYMVAAALWVATFIPAYSWLESSGVLSTQPHLLTLALYGLGDVLLVLAAGCLLQNANLWSLLTNTPLLPSLPRLLVHVIPLLCTTSAFVTLLLFGYEPHFSGMAHLLQVLIAVALPAVVAFRLAKKGETSVLRLNSPITPQANSFSGRNSEFWRRESFIGTRPELLGDGSTAAKTQAAHLSDQGVCAINRDNSVGFVNKRFLDLCKVKTSNAIGKRVDTLGIPAELAAAIIDLVQTSIERGPRTREFRFENADVIYFFELSTLRPESLQSSSLSGGPDSIILTVRDISDRRVLESHLLQAQKLDSLGKIVSGLAHSFNNALMTIAGHASVALHQSDAEQLSKSLREILNTTKSAGDLAKRLLAFAEGKPGTIKTLDIAGVIEQHLELLKRVVGSSFELSFQRPQQEVWVSYDANLVLQALTNVLLNARESYSSAQGKIELSLDIEELTDDLPTLHAGVRPGKFARLRVRDFGCGMNAETLGRAFEPLFSTKTRSGHAGLGLSMAFATLRAHNGFMIAESRPEKGTTISLYFPLSQNTAHENRANTAEINDTVLRANQGERILLVEDDKQVRELTCDMLQSLGYEVESCSTPAEALVHAKQSEFTLALVDLIMPVMQGSDLLNAIREVRPTQAALLMTGLGASEENSTLTIFKPFDLVELSRAVRQAIGQISPANLSNTEGSRSSLSV